MRVFLLLAALLAVTSAASLAKKNAEQDKKAQPNVQHYDWKQWIKKDKSSDESSKDEKSGKEGGGFDWKKYISENNKIPSGLEEEHSFSPFDWDKYMSIGGGVQFYDWKQWLSKREKSSKDSSQGEESGKETGGFNWQELISKYNKIPSGLEDEHNFSPFDWEKFISGGGVQFYDWQQWLSKSNQEESKDEYDWKQWLSNSYIPDGVVQFYDWKQWLSKSAGKSAVTTRKPAGARTKAPSKKVTKSPGKDKYDWKQWLSKSNTGVSTSGNDGKLPKSNVEKSTSGGYDWKQWLSKSGGTSGSGNGGYDWKQWLSKSGKKSDVTSTSDTPVSEVAKSTSEGSGNGGDYDWKQWLSKSVGSDNGGYNWKQWLSKSEDGASDSGVEVGSSTGDDNTSELSTSSDDSDDNESPYDWKQWISKSGGTSGGDWQQWLSNSYAEPPSSIQEEYSFSTFDWNKFVSAA